LQKQLFTAWLTNAGKINNPAVPFYIISRTKQTTSMVICLRIRRIMNSTSQTQLYIHDLHNYIFSSTVPNNKSIYFSHGLEHTFPICHWCQVQNRR